MPDYRTETRLERQYLLRDIFTRIAAYLNTHGSEPAILLSGQILKFTLKPLVSL